MLHIKLDGKIHLIDADITNDEINKKSEYHNFEYSIQDAETKYYTLRLKFSHIGFDRLAKRESYMTPEFIEYVNNNMYQVSMCYMIEYEGDVEKLKEYAIFQFEIITEDIIKVTSFSLRYVFYRISQRMVDDLNIDRKQVLNITY